MKGFSSERVRIAGAVVSARRGSLFAEIEAVVVSPPVAVVSSVKYILRMLPGVTPAVYSAAIKEKMRSGVSLLTIKRFSERAGIIDGARGVFCVGVTVVGVSAPGAPNVGNETLGRFMVRSVGSASLIANPAPPISATSPRMITMRPIGFGAGF